MSLILRNSAGSATRYRILESSDSKNGDDHIQVFIATSQKHCVLSLIVVLK